MVGCLQSRGPPGPTAGFCVAVIMWHDLLSAVALLLVIEGIMPFLSPGGLRHMLLSMSQMDDRTLRIAGLVSMLVGSGMLYLVR